MSVIFITGAAGYIGSALTQYLSRCCTIVEYDLVKGQDIMDYNSLTAAMMKCQPDVVIHLAALSSVPACEKNPALARSINAGGTRNVIRAMKEAGCNRLIYTSTSSVYSPGQHLLQETDTRMPRSAYGITKLLGELIVTSSSSSYIILRLFNVIGGNQQAGTDRLFAALSSGSVSVYGTNYRTRDGTCERDYVGLRDVCRAYRRSVVKLTRSTEPVALIANICTSIPVSVREVIRQWDRQSHSPIEVTNVGRRKGDPARVVGSYRTAMLLLRWYPRQTLGDIVDEIFSKYITEAEDTTELAIRFGVHAAKSNAEKECTSKDPLSN
jgi:UDP-glucose 4-epimerase